MRRRTLIGAMLGGTGGLLAGLPTAAQVPGTTSSQPGQAGTPGAGDGLRPYLQVRPVDGEAGVLRVFFSPSCSFSKAYLPFFKNLQATLPGDWRFALSPLINKGDGMAYAMAFAAVEHHYPAHVSNFVEASLVAVQERGMGPSNWRALERIGQAARVPVSVPQLVWRDRPVTANLVDVALTRQKRLGITNTPSVAVAGTYIATPEFTNGDTTLFSQLINGLVSMSS